MRLSALFAAIFALALSAAVPTWAASKHQSGVSASEMKSKVMTGWSAKLMIMGKDVYNENNDKVGTVNDIILTRDFKAVYAILDVGKLVAVPMHNLKIEKDKILLPGVTKDSFNASPEFRFHTPPKDNK